MEKKKAEPHMDKMEPPESNPVNVTPTEARAPEANVRDVGPPEPGSLLDLVWKEVATVIDPEIGISLKELGLIYTIDVLDSRAVVSMTLTSMGCPAGPELTAGVHAACLRVPGVTDADVQVVWVPLWDPKTMASEEAKMHMGIF